MLPTPDVLRALMTRLEHGLLERDAAVRLTLLAALAGEHVLLIGPPGTAKSELARRLHAAFDGAPYFERLLTRFSTPEELFGPLSLKALEADRYERLTTGFLPGAGIAFLDEVFKANSAILNALLTLLNEREFDNGSGRVATPLVSVVGASNEVPGDEALMAFFDRFLLRVPVAPVGDEAFIALLDLKATPPPGARPLTAGDRAAIAQAADAVVLGEGLRVACTALRRWLASERLGVSDRRWRQWIGLMRTAAATEGRSELDALDLWSAAYVVATSPGEATRVQAWVDAEIAQAVPQDAPWLNRAVQAFERQAEIEHSAPAEDGAPDDAGKLALARSIGLGGSGTHDDEAREGEPAMLRIVSSRLEDRARRRWSPVHVQARLAQVDDVIAQVTMQREAIRVARDALAASLAPRLWMPPSLVKRWLQAHASTLAMLDGVLASLQATRVSFAALPIDVALPAVEPAPLAL